MPTEKELKDFYETNTGAECGKCGCKLTYGNDAGMGFCRKCQDEEDSKE